jgi:hypothetical protein
MITRQSIRVFVLVSYVAGPFCLLALGHGLLHDRASLTGAACACDEAHEETHPSSEPRDAAPCPLCDLLSTSSIEVSVVEGLLSGELISAARPISVPPFLPEPGIGEDRARSPPALS